MLIPGNRPVPAPFRNWAFLASTSNKQARNRPNHQSRRFRLSGAAQAVKKRGLVRLAILRKRLRGKQFMHNYLPNLCRNSRKPVQYKYETRQIVQH